jgi:peptidoglycan/xylan/chitin deacetylase (PgdA/CDA1 family)
VPGRAPAASGRIAAMGTAADVVEHLDQPGRSIALTFDDGPNPPDTAELLDLLAREDVRAVFFLVGEHALAHPELVRRVVDEGHVLGNHTFHHDDLEDWDDDAVRADLERTLAAIRSAVPSADVPFFRAPFGHWGRSVAVARDLGMRSVGWSLAVEDWEPPGVDELVRRLGAVTPGGIVLLHDGGGDRSQTVEAVARLVPRLRDEGWHVTVPR